MLITFHYHEANDDLFAVIFTDNKQGRTVEAYSAIGQHSNISWQYINESKKVTAHRQDVKALKKELISIGYKFK